MTYSIPNLDSLSLEEACEAIWAATEAQKRDERRRIREPALVRIFDGDWNLQHLMQVEQAAEFDFVDNDSGPGVTELPLDTPVAQWIFQSKQRIDRGEKRNVHITVDKNGARWGGRLKDASPEETEDGDQILTVTWMHDYEELKYYTIRSNPFFPASFQAPRVWMLPGPARWALGTTLFVNLLRDNLSLWALPDDPLDRSTWGSLDQSTWPIVVKPLSFMEDMAAGTIWAMPISRWKNFHDMAKPILQDAEISVVCRRWLNGDPPPWPGANLRHGTLVVSFEDNSGVFVGTSHGGSIADGLIRTFAEFAEGFIDSTYTLLTDNEIPDDYYIPGRKLTRPSMPFAIYRPGVTPGVVSAKFTETPSTAIAVGTGGHSMPGVNEVISAAIQAAGDIVGNMLQVGSIGGSIDTLLKPFYEDTVLAWMWVKSLQRSSTAGWSRYFEYFQDGADKAYTLSALMVLRAGFWATRTWTSHELHIIDQAPFLIGDQGQGHLFTGSRVGSTIPGDPTGRVEMDRISKCTLSWDVEKWDDWAITIGDDRKNLDPLVQMMERMEYITGGLHDLGVN